MVNTMRCDRIICGFNSHYLAPLHIMNSGDAMKQIQHKNKRMIELEEKYNQSIEEILRHLYVDQNMTYHQITKELNISYVTVKRWLTKAGIYSKRLNIRGDT